MTRIALGGISLLTPLTGIGQYTSHLAQGLLNQGVNIELFMGHEWVTATPNFLQRPHTGQISASLMKRAWNKFKRHIPGARSTLHTFRQRTFTKGLLTEKRIGIDLYHEPNFIPWDCDIPTITTIHDLSWIRHPETHPIERVRWLNASIDKAISKAHKIIVVSNFIKDELHAVFGQDAYNKTSVIYNGISPEFRPYIPDLDNPVLREFQLQPQSFFLALGTLEPRKNLSIIIQAHKRLPKKIQEKYPLVLVGDQGWLANHLQQELSSNIRYLGYVPQNQLISLLAGTQALVYGSIYEGFGLPIVEAMACGTPVITSTAAALKEVANNAAIHISPNDQEGFQHAMLEIIKNQTLREQLIQLGLSRSRLFSWEKNALETLNLYHTILA